MLFLLFNIGPDCFALEANQVQEVLPLLELRPIPRAPAAVAGLITYRGNPVPVIDLTELALSRASVVQLSTRILLVHYADQRGAMHLLGLIVERATGTCRLSASEFKSPGVSSPGARYLGDVALGPTGLVQHVQVRELLTRQLSALLFEVPLEA